MDDIEVEIVGAQTLERAVDLAVDGFFGKMPIVEVHFAGEHNLVSRDVEIAQRLANVFFGSAEGVAVRGVDDGVLMTCDVADRFERCLIVVHILFDPRVCGGAGLRLPDVEVLST